MYDHSTFYYKPLRFYYKQLSLMNFYPTEKHKFQMKAKIFLFTLLSSMKVLENIFLPRYCLEIANFQEQFPQENQNCKHWIKFAELQRWHVVGLFPGSQSSEEHIANSTLFHWDSTHQPVKRSLSTRAQNSGLLKVGKYALL